MKRAQAYQCDFCTRCFARPSNATQHERSCQANPARRNCKTCVHGCIGTIDRKEPVTWDYDTRLCRDVPDYSFYGAYCDYHNVPIHEAPFNIECETAAPHCNPNGDEIPVPGTCWEYKYKGKCGWTAKNAPTGTESEGEHA